VFEMHFGTPQRRLRLIKNDRRHTIFNRTSIVSKIWLDLTQKKGKYIIGEAFSINRINLKPNQIKLINKISNFANLTKLGVFIRELE